MNCPSPSSRLCSLLLCQKQNKTKTKHLDSFSPFYCNRSVCSETQGKWKVYSTLEQLDLGHIFYRDTLVIYFTRTIWGKLRLCPEEWKQSIPRVKPALPQLFLQLRLRSNIRVPSGQQRAPGSTPTRAVPREDAKKWCTAAIWHVS